VAIQLYKVQQKVMHWEVMAVRMLMASVMVEMLNTAEGQGQTTVEGEEVLSSGLAEAEAEVMVTLPQAV
tara:strand:- start:307 stop:513 length:207 start_codon:yes stop_codon:yes gene_type:complete